MEATKNITINEIHVRSFQNHKFDNNKLNDHKNSEYETINTHFQTLDSKNIKYSYLVDNDTGKILVRVYNYLTGEVINEIPSEIFLNFIKELKRGFNDDELKKYPLLPTGLFIEKST
ncbi:MAG: flagellar protein FlaG [Leptospiraceae bacterium]|nr:flagellar protein FlaG [Leptospiraceae bacterium]MDW7976520.1 flagellar protein FlaG [Leptospiraceae bacterium]